MKFLLIILLLNISATVSGRTIIVGANEPVKTLKQAIAVAKDNDTIRLSPGIYKEGNIILTKSLTLIGDNAILDGVSQFEILTVSGKNIVIKGIQFQNSGYSSMNDYAALKVIDASYIVIEGNKFLNSYFAIHLNNSTFCTVRNNRIAGSPKTEQTTGNGIHLWKCNNALIEANFITGHRDGIYFEFVSHSTIQKNISQENIRYGLHFMYSNDDVYLSNTFHDNGAGVAVMYSKKVTMQFNHFEQNWGASAYGLLLKDISDSYISNNTFYKNTVALHMEGTSRIEVEKNIFKENGWAMKVQASCDNNNFHHNNYFGNTFDIATNGTMVLNKFYNNYWDKYDGYDLNKDGFGDVPYHPVNMYSMIVEENPNALILLRSFTVQLLDKAEKAIPSLTPENLIDTQPTIKPNKL
ncbi:MAG: nitrous oxide reductase family maturation protein NosD [Bacteroidetes bacterium]|nr:MAG: nitrous oxide reductase family maturation protein NosD [Bacteroidota bacterium]